MDPATYYDGTWAHSLDDSENILEVFFTTCSASPECGIHEDTPAKVRARYERIVAKLAAKPLPYVYTGWIFSGFGIARVEQLHALTLIALHSPYTWFSTFSAVLQDLDVGDPFLMSMLAPEYKWRCDTNITNEYLSDLWPYSKEVQTAFMCNDIGSVPDVHDEIKLWLDERAAKSRWADLLAHRVSCVGWEIKAPFTFSGLHSVHPQKITRLLQSQGRFKGRQVIQFSSWAPASVRRIASESIILTHMSRSDRTSVKVRCTLTCLTELIVR